MTNIELQALLKELPDDLPVMIINHHNPHGWRLENIIDPTIRKREMPGFEGQEYVCIEQD